MLERSAFTSSATSHTIAFVSLFTETHRPVFSCQIIYPRLAKSVSSTWVWSAEILLGERSAGNVWISCVCAGAGTYGLVLCGLT